MAQVMRALEEAEARGWHEVDTTICSRCVSEPALVELVRHNGGSEPCDYCENEPEAPYATAPFDLVLEAVVDGIKLEYERPVDVMGWSSAEGGWLGARTFDTYDLLWELEITEQENVHDELLSAIVESEWCEYDPYAVRPHEALTDGWGNFREYVKHQRRYTFLIAEEDRTLGAGELQIDRVPFAVSDAVEAANRLLTLPVGSEWWRGRPHAKSSDCWSSAHDLAAPPEKFAKDNRMSAKGVSAFYGASTRAGARAEIAGYTSEAADIGLFRTTVELAVVDLRHPPEIPSLFSPERYRRAATRFLHSFVADISKTADPSDEQVLDYIPTQIIVEFFRHLLSVGERSVAGVLWRSSKDPSVDCCVLFVPNEATADEAMVDASSQLVMVDASIVHEAALPD